MSLRVRIEHGQDAGKTWRLPEAGVYTLGRAPANSLRVLDMKVSKRHCEIRVATTNGRVRAVLHDAESTTGCQLNGQPVPHGRNVALKAGDELRVGLSILRILSDGTADEDAKPVVGRATDEAAMGGTAKHDTGKTKATLPPDDLVGKSLSGYHIERKIGAGGMGGVYLAEQTSLQRKVALKVLNERFAEDSAFVDQFVNEARAAGALNHPNVVQVYDVGSAEGHYFFSMEVMPGGSIEDRIKEGPVEWEVGLNWFLDAANALIFAKRREILHRDVKPDNLMIGEDGSAKLCDLGLAKKSEVSDLMDAGIIGTPHFISPEAVRRKSDIDHRTDLYSLGCTFYRVFTGKNPYPGTSVKEILLGHLNKPIPRVSESNRNVPRELDEVIYALMRKDPEDRIQTPEDLLKELDKIRTKYNLEAHGLKPGSKKPLVIALVAALMAVGGAIWFVATREDVVREQTLTPEQREAALRAKRTNAEKPLSDYVIDAERRFTQLNTEFIKGDIEEEDNWKKPVFGRIAKDARVAADRWAGKVTEWAKDKGEHEDEVILGFYDTYSAALGGHIDAARELATKIESTITEFRDNEQGRKEARASALARTQGDIKTYAQGLQKLFDEKKFLELERRLDPGALQKIVDDLLALAYRGRASLKFDKDVLPLLDKQLPGDKEGKNRGGRLLVAAEQTIARSADLALNEAQQAIASKPGYVEFQKALEALKRWSTTVPETLDLEGAPRISRAWTRAAEKIDRAREQLDKRLQAYDSAILATDRDTYFRFLVDLWAPRTGLLRRFELAVAREKAEKLEATLKHGKYKSLGRRWPTPVAALETLFKDLVAGYPDGWTEKHTYLEDKSGKPKKEPIKGIDSTGVQIDRDTYPFSRLGAAGVLEKVFYVDGQLRMTECSPIDHLGLALLFELAGDYDKAVGQYQAAKGGSDADTQQLINIRLGELGAERQAAEKYVAIARFLAASEAFAAQAEAQLREAQSEPESLSGDERGRIIEMGTRITRELEQYQAMRDDLLENGKLAATVWGSSLRESVHPRVAYAGEKLPEPEKKPGPPRKPRDGSKDGGAQK